MNDLKCTLLIFMLCLLLLSAITGCDSGGSNGEGSENMQRENTGKNTDIDEIESLEKIELGGIEQWIYINGNDKTKPVLLFLHGGPGYVMMPILHLYNSELEDHFIVVNWDQRGAGLSYSRDIPRGSMTQKQFISDVHELTIYLKEKFNKDKIYLVGHSFGTVFGMEAINRYPEDYWAFVGVGQVVDFGENEQLGYDFALESARKDNNQKAIKQLTGVGRPDEDGNYNKPGGYSVTMRWIEHYGGDIYGETSTEVLETEIYESEIYEGELDKIVRGYEFSDLLFEDEDILNINFREQIKKVDVPVYFFSGRHDYDTPFKLVEEYYSILSAPNKGMVWFENSAHFPFYEEPEKFNREMIDRVLPETLNPSGITGNWTGSYSVADDKTRFDLKVLRQEDGSYLAQVCFDIPVAKNDKGIYELDVDFSNEDGSIKLVGTEWILKPPGYEMISFFGNVSDDSMSGSVFLSDNKTVIGEFSLKK